MSAYSIINIDLIKSMTNMPTENTTKDNLYSIAIKAGIKASENYCRRNFNQQEYVGKGFVMGDDIQLSSLPVIEVKEVKIDDDIITDYKVIKSLGIIKLEEEFEDDFEVTYTGGYEELPDDLFQAICLTIINLFTKYQKIADGANSVVTSDGTINYNMEAIPQEAKQILNRYKRLRIWA